MREDRILRVALDWAVDEIDPPRSFGGWNTGRVVQQTHESLVEDDFDTAPTPAGVPTQIVPRLAEHVDMSRTLAALFFDCGTAYAFMTARRWMPRRWFSTTNACVVPNRRITRQ